MLRRLSCFDGEMHGGHRHDFARSPRRVPCRAKRLCRKLENVGADADCRAHIVTLRIRTTETCEMCIRSSRSTDHAIRLPPVVVSR